MDPYGLLPLMENLNLHYMLKYFATYTQDIYSSYKVNFYFICICYNLHTSDIQAEQLNCLLTTQIEYCRADLCYHSALEYYGKSVLCSVDSPSSGSK